MVCNLKNYDSNKPHAKGFKSTLATSSDPNAKRIVTIYPGYGFNCWEEDKKRDKTHDDKKKKKVFGLF